MDPHLFLKLGNKYTKSVMSSPKIALRRLKSFFGVTPEVCSVVWSEIEHSAPPAAQPIHLLWCLSFLKEYSTEHYRHSIFDADEKTMRELTWTFVKLISNLNVILHEKRYDGAIAGQTSFCSLDGVDFKIQEPSPFSPQWYSHKLHCAGLRYEVGLCIRTGDIVWTNGGYPCGTYPDLKLAREAYVSLVDPGELTVADKGYKDQTFFILKTAMNADEHQRIMARHETVNKRMKQFKILKNAYRHPLEKHPIVFLAVANLTQLMIENGFPLFSI